MGSLVSVIGVSSIIVVALETFTAIPVHVVVFEALRFWPRFPESAAADLDILFFADFADGVRHFIVVIEQSFGTWDEGFDGLRIAIESLGRVGALINAVPIAVHSDTQLIHVAARRLG